MQGKKGRIVNLKRVVTICVSAVVWIFSAFRNCCAVIVGHRTPALWTVLYYHSISPDQRERFCRQMDVLLRLTKPTLLGGSEASNNLKARTTVTFDDGFLSYREIALPEMMKRGIPSILFVPSGWMGKQADWAVNNSVGEMLEKVLDSRQLNDLGKNPLVAIGSHCVSHRDLCSLEERDSTAEIWQSRKDLQAATGTEVNMLSFPYGSFDESHIAIAQHAGYQKVFSTMPISYENDRDFLIGRVTVDVEDSWFEFRMKLAGAYRWLPLAIKFKKKLYR
jgi:peptidoglycan/xylan/chitin deacetylase (PgdA/CDA1 family)